MTSPFQERPNPDDLLREIQARENVSTRGRLKVFLGYASGVGKTFRMLDEARRRRDRGEDILVAAVQPTVPPDAQRVLSRLEQIPTRLVQGKSVLDMDAILRRHPGVCVVDGLAFTNPPSSRFRERYREIQHLLGAGIHVLTSVNLQYISELRTQVQAITGKIVTDTVPVAFIHSADEIEVVDAPPESTKPGLAQLRELALVLAAGVVDHQLEQYLLAHGVAPGWGAQERVLVCLTPRSDSEAILASGRRNADRFHGELFAVYVRQPGLSGADRSAVEQGLESARRLGAQVEVIEGKDPVRAILGFARQHGITQIFVGHPGAKRWHEWIGRGPVDRLLDEATDMDLQIFPL